MTGTRVVDAILTKIVTCHEMTDGRSRLKNHVTMVVGLIEEKKKKMGAITDGTITDVVATRMIGPCHCRGTSVLSLNSLVQAIQALISASMRIYLLKQQVKKCHLTLHL